ncbi:MAG: LysM peptidoglycan-binding domain-containing protein [Alistipes sp.]|nr:LysM peptidoglycan-binding domain-containing protein [Alistipes sp.]
MKLIRFVLPLLMLTIVVGAKAQTTEQVVVVNGKMCIVHTVVENDTFYSLAKHYDVPLKQIIQINGEENAEKLAVGAKIYIPYNEKVEKRTTKEKVAAAEDAPKSIDGDFIIHTIVANDTLYSIAKHYKISLDQLIADNPDADAHNLTVGSTLLVRTAKVGYASIKDIDKEIKRYEKEADDNKTDKVKYHTVAYGDTLYSLARRYKTTEQEIMALNGFTSSDQLLSGMKIIVHGMVADAPVAVEKVEKAEEQVAEAEPAEEQPKGVVPMYEFSFNADSLISYVQHNGFNHELDEQKKEQIDSMEAEQKVRIPSFKRFARGEQLNVVIMLPMHRDGKIVKAFVDHYRGMLLAFKALRSEGYSINVTVFDTERTAVRISEIMETEAFKNADMLIGPIYAEEVAMVLPFAEEKNIPVINPLTDIDPAVVSSPVLFQMQADKKYQYEKYAHILDGSYQINIILGPTNDMEYLNEVLALTEGLPRRLLNARIGREVALNLRNDDGSNGVAVSKSSLVRGAGKKAIFVVANRDHDIGMILKNIGEHSESMTQGGANDCFVVASRKIDNLTYVDREGFFTSGVSLITPYNMHRTDNIPIKIFEADFLQTYGILPTPYAGRGYDAVMMFCTKMHTGLDKYILLERITPLATPYQFKWEDGMFVNTEWVNIQYDRFFSVRYE